MQSATTRAYEHIREGILDGRYPTGTMLGEVALAESIGVSRTPVRTALVLLQDEGWITVYPKRGALVRGLSERAAADLAEARFLLESSGVQRASSTERTSLARTLLTSIDAQQRAFVERDLRGFIELTIAFHRSFVEVGGNAVLIEMDARLGDRQLFLLFTRGEQLLDRCADIIAEHRRLLDHLASDDAEGFAHALRAHLTSPLSDAGRSVRAARFVAG